MLEALFFFVLGGGVLSIACSNRRAWREIERKSEPAPEWLAMAKAHREKYGDSVPAAGRSRFVVDRFPMIF